MTYRSAVSCLALWMGSVAFAAACGGLASETVDGSSSGGDGDGDGDDGFVGDGDIIITGDGDRGDGDFGDGDGPQPPAALSADCDAAALNDLVEDPERAINGLSEMLWGVPASEDLRIRAFTTSTRSELYELALEMLRFEVLAPQGAGEFFPWWVTGRRELQTPTKNAMLFPSFGDSSYVAMRDEVIELGYRVIDPEQGLGFSELLLAPAAVNGEHRWVYEPEPMEGGALFFEAGERFGLFSTPLFATNGSHDELTSPAVRGRIVREQLLCGEIPPPPIELPPIDPDSYEPPMRAWWNENVGSPACQGCHVQIGELGLAFEEFDPVGAFRTTEEGHPIDTFTFLAGFATEDLEFEHPREMMAYLSQSAQAWECHGAKWFEFYFGEDSVALRGGAEDVVNPLVACAAESGEFHPAEFVALLAVSDAAQSSFACGTQRCLEGEKCYLTGPDEGASTRCMHADDALDCTGCNCSTDTYGNETVDCSK